MDELNRIRCWVTQRFELHRAGDSGENLVAMEGMRGLAVFLVFLVHLASLAKPAMVSPSALFVVADALEKMGNVGVDLFFVLSGYLIYGSLIRKPQSYARFMSRRIIRIYPAFLVVFLIYLGLSFAFPAQSKLPEVPAEAALYLMQNILLLPGLFPIEPMITVAWSLSYEFAFYLVLPGIVAGLRLRQWAPGARVLLIVCAAITLIAICAVLGGPVRMIMFLSGMVLYETKFAPRRVALPHAAAPLALGIGLSTTLWPIEGAIGSTLKMVTLATAFYVACAIPLRRSGGGFCQLYHWTPLRWLGNMSYSYYLIHGLTLKVAFVVLERIWPLQTMDWGVFLLTATIMFTLTLIPAVALFLIVERPLSLSTSRAPVQQKAAAGIS